VNTGERAWSLKERLGNSVDFSRASSNDTKAIRRYAHYIRVFELIAQSFRGEGLLKVLMIKNCDIEGPGYIREYLINKGIQFDLLSAHRGGVFPSMDEFDAFFVFGTPISANNIKEHQFLEKESSYIEGIVEADKPYLGICFGGQILAVVLGAEVRRNPVMEIGSYQVRLTDEGKSDPLFRSFPEVFPVFHWHGDTFDIPKGALKLAAGEACLNQAFRCGRAYALQFHLETKCSDVAVWARAYASELSSVGKRADQVLKECDVVEEETRSSCYLMLNNFFKRVVRSR